MLPPPLGNSGSSSFSREIRGAAAVFAAGALFSLELDFLSSLSGFSDLVRFDGRGPELVLLDLVVEAPPGPSLRLRDAMIASGNRRVSNCGCSTKVGVLTIPMFSHFEAELTAVYTSPPKKFMVEYDG